MRIIDNLATTNAQYLIITDYCWWGFVRLADNIEAETAGKLALDMKIHWKSYSDIGPSVNEEIASMVQYNRTCRSNDMETSLNARCKWISRLARKQELISRLNTDLPIPAVSRKIMTQTIQKMFSQRIFDFALDDIDMLDSNESGLKAIITKQFDELIAFQKNQSIPLLKTELLAYSRLGELQGNCIPYFLALAVSDSFAKWPSNELNHGGRGNSTLISYDTFYTSDLNSENYRKPSILLEAIHGFITFSEWASKRKPPMPSNVYMTEQEIKKEVCSKITRVVLRIHGLGMAHGNINGDHVLINEDNLSVVIVSFSRAAVDLDPSKLKNVQQQDLDNVKVLANNLKL